MEVCVLTSGSCGNCIYIGTANSSVVIDNRFEQDLFETIARMLWQKN